ncbi:metalloregulator ArsR/SmtB family transcription factor [Streptomyces sp. NPDC094034]|uniref:ArsR/SmtB family transcription factor n=1 Tax=Streptomyces sp. NPDC094034 TaxID=3155309 RepID=UPI003333B521
MPNPSTPDSPPERPPGRRSEPTPAQIMAGAETFALLASPSRLHLVWLITHGPYDVGSLATRVGLSIATTSQHLSKLRLAGVITARRDGRRHIYTVEDPHVLTLVEQIFEHIAPDGTLAPDPTPA